MAIEFNKTFGDKSNTGKGSKADLPKAQFWLNIGYPVELDTPEGTEHRFVSLPMGIPLDTQEPLPTNSRNVSYAQFSAARNDLHSQIMAVAAQLEPGEEKELNLVIQLRRVNEEQADVSPDNNPMVRKLNL